MSKTPEEWISERENRVLSSCSDAINHRNFDGIANLLLTYATQTALSKREGEVPIENIHSIMERKVRGYQGKEKWSVDIYAKAHPAMWAAIHSAAIEYAQLRVDPLLQEVAELKKTVAVSERFRRNDALSALDEMNQLRNELHAALEETGRVREELDGCRKGKA